MCITCDPPGLDDKLIVVDTHQIDVMFNNTNELFKRTAQLIHLHTSASAQYKTLQNLSFFRSVVLVLVVVFAFVVFLQLPLLQALWSWFLIYISVASAFDAVLLLLSMSLLMQPLYIDFAAIDTRSVISNLK